MDYYAAHKIPFIKKMPYHGQFINCVKFFKDIKFPLYHGYNYVKITTPPTNTVFLLCLEKTRRSSNKINQWFIFEQQNWRLFF